jgi:aconitate decarboxylase
MYVEISIELNDGQIIRRRCDAPMGSWSRPVPDERVTAKASALLTEAIGAEKTAAVERAIAATGRFHIRPLMALLA